MAAVNSRLGRRESALLVHRSSGSVNSGKVPSPNSAAYRKTFMTRRHSSGTSDTPIVRDTSPHCVNNGGNAGAVGVGEAGNQLMSAAFHHHHGSYPLVADERRWSIANPAESTSSCRRPSTLFNPSDLRLRRSPSPSVTFAPQSSQQQQQRSSREDLEVPSSSSQRILSRKGSNSSQCCQETIPEHEDGHMLEAPNSPTTATLASASGALRGSGNHLHVPTINGGGGGDGDGSESDDSASGGAGGGFSGHLRVRRHRSLPSPTFTTEKLLASNFPQHQRSNSFRLPSHRATSEPNGRWRIKVKKSRPFLGIVIEGGDNVTTQTQPRIISIHQSGAAIECGDLHVGHIILEIDGNSTEDMNHEQVAQAISRAYYNTPHKDYIEFLVREKSRAEFDLRRSSFMLLNNSFE